MTTSNRLITPTPGSGDLNGAAVIDDAGREIPITEHMIQHCLQGLLAPHHESPGNSDLARYSCGLSS